MSKSQISILCALIILSSCGKDNESSAVAPMGPSQINEFSLVTPQVGESSTRGSTGEFVRMIYLSNISVNSEDKNQTCYYNNKEIQRTVVEVTDNLINQITKVTFSNLNPSKSSQYCLETNSFYLTYLKDTNNYKDLFFNYKKYIKGKCLKNTVCTILKENINGELWFSSKGLMKNSENQIIQFSYIELPNFKTPWLGVNLEFNYHEENLNNGEVKTDRTFSNFLELDVKNVTKIMLNQLGNKKYKLVDTESKYAPYEKELSFRIDKKDELVKINARNFKYPIDFIENGESQTYLCPAIATETLTNAYIVDSNSRIKAGGVFLLNMDEKNTEAKHLKGCEDYFTKRGEDVMLNTLEFKIIDKETIEVYYEGTIPFLYKLVL